MRIPKSRYDIVIDIICLLCLIGLVLFLAIAWPNIPDEIPGHYNAKGEIDKIAGKGSLIFLAAMGWAMYALLFVVELFPQTWNTGVKVTKENMYRVYRTLKSMIGILKLLMVLVFTFLAVYSALALPLPLLFTPVYLILIFGSIIFFTVKLIMVK